MMGRETAEARMARVQAAIVASDEARLNTLCDPDIVVEQAAALPYGGVYKGVAGLLAMLKGLRETLCDIRVSREGILSDASGDHILVLQGLRARSARTGKPIEMSVAELFSFRDGRLVSIRPHYFDAKALYDACRED